MNYVDEMAAPQESTHIMAQVEAFKQARDARLRELKEGLKQMEKDTCGGGTPVRGGDVLDGQERALRLRERALEEQTLKVEQGGLERLRFLDEKEKKMKSEVEEVRAGLQEMERKLQAKIKLQESEMFRMDEANLRTRKDLDDRAATLDSIDKDLSERGRQILQREADLISRGKEVELRERTLDIKEKDYIERIAILNTAEQSEKDRIMALDERERGIKFEEEKSKRNLEDRWKMLEESIHLFETRKHEDQLQIKRLGRDLEERQMQLEKLEGEVRMKEKQLEDLRLQLSQREMKLNDIEQRAIDRLKRELSERESALRMKPQPSTDLFTPTKARRYSLANPSPPSNTYASSHIPYPAQSQSPTELSPDSNIGDP